MRRSTKIGLGRIVLGGIVVLVVAGSGLPAAAGEVSFAFGAGFAVGGMSFQIAYASPQAGYAPFYYRTAAPMRYSGYGCGSYCFKSGAHWYHGPSCGLVRHHFSLHGYFGPQMYGPSAYGPQAYGPGYYVEGYVPYGPAPGHYLPYYSRGSQGHRHRGHGYSTYRYYGSYGYRGYNSGYGRGYGYRPGNGRGRGHSGAVGPRGDHHRGRAHGRPPGSARKTRPPQP